MRYFSRASRGVLAPDGGRTNQSGVRKMQQLHPHLTTWHITWGTYGARIHGDNRPTVDKTHNQPGEEYIGTNSAREKSVRDRMRFPPVILTSEQQRFIESI